MIRCKKLPSSREAKPRGLTWFIPGEDPSFNFKQQIFARVVGALGGRAAEEIVFGEAEITTGAGGVATSHLHGKANGHSVWYV